MTPETTPAAPETPAPEPTIDAGPDAKPKPKPRLLSRGTSRLPVALTETEQVAKAKEAAAKQAKIRDIEREETETKSRLKSRREGLEVEVSDLLKIIEAGEETREIKIETREVEGYAITYRLDTGAEVDRRELRAEERQGTLPLAPPAPAKPETTPEALRVLVVSALYALGASGVIRVAEELALAEVVVAPSRIAEVLGELAREGLTETNPITGNWRLTKAGQVASAEIMAKVAAKDAPVPAAKTQGRTAAEPEEGSNEGDRRKVLDALRGKELTRKELVAATGLSSEVVGDCLSDLVGLTAQVTKVGKGPGTRYARILDAAAEPAPPTPKPPAPPPSPADPFALAPGPRA